MKKHVKEVLIRESYRITVGDYFNGSHIKNINMGQENGQMAHVPIIILTMEDGTVWEINKSKVLGVSFTYEYS